MAPIRLGIIGLSADPKAWARLAHVPPLKSAPLSKKYSITAVATSSEKSAKAAAEAHHIPADHAYHSAEDIANSPEVDMVVVSVKVPMHKELTMPILKAKKDVFVEWPLGNGLQEAEELAALAKKQGVQTVVGLQARNLPIVLKAKEMIESGVLGRVTTSHIFTSSSRINNYPEKGRYLNEKTNGANMISIATAHLLDPLCFLLGEFRSLNATTATTYPSIQFTKDDGTKTAPEPRQLADSIAIHGVLESGTTVSFTNVYTTEATPDSLEWIIAGEEGSLKFTGASSFLAFSPAKLHLYKPAATEESQKRKNVYKPVEGERWAEVDVGSPTPAFGGIGLVYDAFASGKKGTYVDFDEAVKRHRMVEAIYRSAEKGTRETY